MGKCSVVGADPLVDFQADTHAEAWNGNEGADLLDIGCWHVVFTLPHALSPVAQANPALIYRLLFKAASRTLLAFGHNPR